MREDRRPGRRLSSRAGGSTEFTRTCTTTTVAAAPHRWLASPSGSDTAEGAATVNRATAATAYPSWRACVPSPRGVPRRRPGWRTRVTRYRARVSCSFARIDEFTRVVYTRGIHTWHTRVVYARGIRAWSTQTVGLCFLFFWRGMKQNRRFSTYSQGFVYVSCGAMKGCTDGEG